jgi:hypothetical protein
MNRDPKETTLPDFIDLIRRKGPQWASISHCQVYPSEISPEAIMKWHYDWVLFAIDRSGRRIEMNRTMPAVHIYE